MATVIASGATLALQPDASRNEIAARSPGSTLRRLRPVPLDHGRSAAIDPLYLRALLLWPGLDRVRLGRTRGDPHKIARLIARRTIHSEETILALLERA